MKEGLLWYDNDPQHTLAEKIKRAAIRYQVKFGRQPNLCYLNAADFDGQTEEINGIRLRTVTNIIRHHLWIGVDNDTQQAYKQGVLL